MGRPSRAGPGSYNTHAWQEGKSLLAASGPGLGRLSPKGCERGLSGARSAAIIQRASGPTAGTSAPDLDRGRDGGRVRARVVADLHGEWGSALVVVQAIARAARREKWGPPLRGTAWSRTRRAAAA